MEANSVKQNKMGVMPIPKLLLNMAIPLTVSLIIQSLYNIIDSLFLSYLGENVLTAVSLAATLQNLMSGTASGIGVGITALVAQYLGAKQRDKASRAAMNGILVELFFVILSMLAGTFLLRPFFRSQTQDEEIIRYGMQYLGICMICSVGMFGEVTLERILNSTGRNAMTMLTQSAGAVINVALDPLFIFALNLGVRGAALATVLSQLMAMVLAYCLNRWKNPDLDITLRGFRPEGDMIFSILRVGIPATFMSIVTSVMNFMINRLVTSFSTSAMAVYGIYAKLQHFVQSPLIGVSSSIVPIVAFSYGAKNRKRIMETLRWSMIYCFIVLGFAAFLFMAFPGQILSFFNPTEAMLEAGLPIFRIVGFTFLLSSPSQCCTSTLQGIGNGTSSLIIIGARQVLVRLPLAYLFAHIGGLSMLWYCWPISELVSDIVACSLMAYMDKKKLRPMDRALVENPQVG